MKLQSVKLGFLLSWGKVYSFSGHGTFSRCVFPATAHVHWQRKAFFFSSLCRLQPKHLFFFSSCFASAITRGRGRCTSRLDLTGLRKLLMMQKQGKTGRLIPKVDWPVQWVSRLVKAVGDDIPSVQLVELFTTPPPFPFLHRSEFISWVFCDRTLIRNWSSRRKAFGWRDERSQGKSTKWMRIFGMKIGSVLGSVLFCQLKFNQSKRGLSSGLTSWHGRPTLSHSVITVLSFRLDFLPGWMAIEVQAGKNLFFLVFLSLVASKITELMRPRGIWPFN